MSRPDPYKACPCGSGKKFKFCCRSKGTSDPEPSIAMPPGFDFRSMEGVLAGLTGQRGGASALERAQDLIYRAWETSGRERIALARKALALSADCADAYVVLAEDARDDQERLELLRKAMEAAERTLGKEYFEENEGDFWSLLETRPYMRARRALADLLHESGRVEEAAQHYRELLRLNPNDNQGNRDCLAACLIELGGWEELSRLHERYDDDATAGAYFSRVVLEFMRNGATPRARKLLEEADDANPYVLEYLSGERKMPKELPGLIEWGGPSEAAEFLALYSRGLSRHPQFMQWLLSMAEAR